MFWENTKISERAQQYGEKLLRRKTGVGLIALFTTSVITLVFSERGGTPSANIATGIASALLSFMLVVLYWQQYEIMSDQEELMRASQRPIIDISLLRPFALHREEENKIENSVEITLENVGDGVAVSPYLGIDGSIEGGPTKMNPARSPLGPATTQGDERRWGGLDTTIRAGASKTYSTPVMGEVEYEDGEVERNYLPKVLRQSYDQGGEELILSFNLIVYDSVSESHRSQILYFEVDFELLFGDSEKEITLKDIFTAAIASTADQVLSHEQMPLDEWTQKEDILTRNVVSSALENELGENKSITSSLLRPSALATGLLDGQILPRDGDDHLHHRCSDKRVSHCFRRRD